MLTIKDYAAQAGVSYEAVRQQIKRYSAELDGHIVKDGRTRCLDDYAQQFLDEKRKKNPIIIQQASKDDEIQALVQENKALLLKVTELQDLLLQERELTKQLQGKLIDSLQSKSKENEAVLDDEADAIQNGAESDEKPPIDVPVIVDSSEIKNKTLWERIKAWFD